MNSHYICNIENMYTSGKILNQKTNDLHKSLGVNILPPPISNKANR